MAFMSKKKRWKFDIDLTIEGATSISLTNGTLFVKIRLVDGKGIDNNVSEKVQVKNHEITWNHNVAFIAKMTSNNSTDVLKTYLVRISVRLDEQGGKSYKKLGYVELDLAEYAKNGEPIRKRCLLKSYDAKKRPDNTLLCIKLGMKLVEGSPNYICKEPEQTSDTTDSKLKTEDGASVASLSSGFGSLTRGNHVHMSQEPEGGIGKGHSRHGSQVDMKVSGYSTGHSRHSSSGADMISFCTTGSSSTWPKNERYHMRGKIEQHVGETRPNNGNIIDTLLSHKDSENEEDRRKNNIRT